MQAQDRCRPPGAPPPTPVSDWGAAEENAVSWLRWLGHHDAHRTQAGADHGVDVTGADVAAQVKWYGTAVGVRPVRELVGAAAGALVTMYFFCNAGFTRAAIAYADRVGVALFRYSPADGFLSAANPTAEQVYMAAARRHGRPDVEANLGTRLRGAYQSALKDAPPPKATGPVSRTAVAVALAPIGMCLVGTLVIVAARHADNPGPDWFRQAWAAWMAVACLGFLPAVLIAKLVQDSKTRAWQRGTAVTSSNTDDPTTP
jgi:Restriction endonuclease